MLNFVVAALPLGLVFMASTAGAEPSAERISDAVSPLPESLQRGATVVAYNEQMERQVLREGTNSLVCVADGPQPGFAVACLHHSMEQFWVRGVELRGQGKSPREADQVRITEMEEGKLPIPNAGVARYYRVGATREGALPIMAMEIPYATEESTGMSTEPSSYRPWLMNAGTAQAHVMIPGK